MNEMAFATLKDFNGEIELMFFPIFWEKCKNRIKEDRVLALIVNVQIFNDGHRKLNVCGIQNINKLFQQTMLKLPNNRIKKLLSGGQKLSSSKRKLKR